MIHRHMAEKADEYQQMAKNEDRQAKICQERANHHRIAADKLRELEAGYRMASHALTPKTA